MEWDKISLEQQIPGEQESPPLTLQQELQRLVKMYHKAKADQLGITLGLMDIQAEVALLYKERGLQVPCNIWEFFKP